jgi:hypothetical protein
MYGLNQTRQETGSKVNEMPKRMKRTPQFNISMLNTKKLTRGIYEYHYLKIYKVINNKEDLGGDKL